MTHIFMEIVPMMDKANDVEKNITTWKSQKDQKKQKITLLQITGKRESLHAKYAAILIGQKLVNEKDVEIKIRKKTRRRLLKTSSYELVKKYNGLTNEKTEETGGVDGEILNFRKSLVSLDSI